MVHCMACTLIQLNFLKERVHFLGGDEYCSRMFWGKNRPSCFGCVVHTIVKGQGIGLTYWSRYICAQSWKARVLGEPFGQGTFALRVERPGYWGTYWSRYICAQSWKTRVLGEPIGQGTFALRVERPGYWGNLLVKVHLCSELKGQGIGWTFWSSYICAQSRKTRVLGEPIGQGTFVLRVERPGYWVNLLVEVHLRSE